MVSFTCQACQETVKKNKVDAHCRKCRACWVLTCLDCNKDFAGEAFREHVRCISEAEKYQGKLFKGVKGSQYGKKAKNDPQARFMAKVRRAAASGAACAAHANVPRVVARLADSENVPRKRAKFANFLRNSFRGEGSYGNNGWIDAAWDYIEAHGTDPAEEAARKAAAEAEAAKKKAAAEARVAKEAAREAARAAAAGSFRWKKAIRRAFKAAGKPAVRVKKLRKAVLAEAKRDGGAALRALGKGELMARFATKLASSTHVKLEADGKTVVKYSS